MQALVFHGKGDVKLETRPIPKILEGRDAIVKVKCSTICTSDLHIIHGAVPNTTPNIILGHEFCGEVVEVGSQITNLKPGDRVSANCETFCGSCWFCQRGFINNCVNGGWKLGHLIDGCQAEYVRVPFADTGLTKLPENVSYEQALFVGDILSSGYFGAELAEVKNGDCVVILGSGPVGLCTAQCARLMGAKTIIISDINDQRLKLAKDKNLADVCVNPNKDNLKEIVMQYTEGRGADGVVECAGGENTFETAWDVARPNAIVALVAMYENDQVFPLPKMYGKNLIFKTGGVDARHCQELVNFISEGKLNTDFLITHKGTLSDIMKGYKIFEEHIDGCLKWVVESE